MISLICGKEDTPSNSDEETFLLTRQLPVTKMILRASYHETLLLADSMTIHKRMDPSEHSIWSSIAFTLHFY